MEEKDSYLALVKVALGLALIVALFFIITNKLDWAKGFALGSIFSVLNLVLLKRGLAKRLGKSTRRVRIEAYGSIIFRYFFLAIPMVVAFKLKGFNLVATIVGLFNVQFSILLYYLLWERIKALKNK